MWPKRIRKRNPYTADELIGRNCERDVEKILKARGSGTIIEVASIDAGMLIGRVSPPGGGEINIWHYHRTVLDEGRYYDPMTGPNGMTEEEYSSLFEFWDQL